VTSRRVLPIEHDLVLVVRAATGMLPPRAVGALLVRDATSEERAALARGLTEGAYGALRNALAAGCARALVLAGGWRDEVFFQHGGGLRRGRMWERTPPPLSFTRFSYSLASWLVCAPQGAPKLAAAPPLAPGSDGDELFAYLVCKLLSALELPFAPLATVFRSCALAPLAFPEALGNQPAPPIHLERLCREPLLLEALQRDLERHLLRLERHKRTLRAPADLLAVSSQQEAWLAGLCDAASAVGRVDLLRFVAAASGPIARMDAAFDELDPNETLQRRSEARRAAAGVLRVAERVAALHARMRRIGFVDDGYDEAQVLLELWEPFTAGLASASDALRARAALA
jgi:hypothetical protein